MSAKLQLANSAKEFSNNLMKFAVDIEADVSVVVRKEVLKLFTRIVRESPVLTGAYRASHGISNIEPVGDEAIAATPPGKVVKEGNTTVFTGTPLTKPGSPAWKWRVGDGTIWLFNNVPYAERIEYGGAGGGGWSQQAPEGVYRVALHEFNTLFGGDL